MAEVRAKSVGVTDPLHHATGLRDLGDGLFVATDFADISYPPDGHDGCYAIEEESFWFTHRNAVLLQALEQFPPGGLLLDVGGGNGYVTRALLDAGHDAALLEPGAAGIANARTRNVRTTVQASFEQARFQRASLPAAGLFDVLEHVVEDDAFVSGLSETLMPGGRLYLTVPAFGWLWSHADVHAGHHRRYTRDRLAACLRQSGFEVERLTHFFSFLAAPIFLARTLPDRFRPPTTDRQTQSEREHRPPGFLRQALGALGGAELQWLSTGRPLPVGSSLLAVARR